MIWLSPSTSTTKSGADQPRFPKDSHTLALLGDGLRSIAQAAVGRYILPAACVFCERPLTSARDLAETTVPNVCGSCLSALPYRRGQERSFTAASTSLLFSGTLNERQCQTTGIAACYYEDPIPSAVAALKFSTATWYANTFGDLIAQAFQAVWKGEPMDLVLPIPLHRARLKERGYNQAERIGARAAKRLALPLADDVLVRGRATARQSELEDPASRYHNVSGSFHTKTDLLGKRIILVDDVLTTGATALAAAEALYQAGAKEIVILTVAAV